jgi:hypothetical protein
MARKPASKPGKPERDKVQLSLLKSQSKRLRLVAAELGIDMSEVVGQLIDTHYPSVHIRGLDKADPAGQGRAGQDEPPVPTVRISGVSNRIGEIARRSTAGHDDALDEIASQ